MVMDWLKVEPKVLDLGLRKKARLVVKFGFYCKEETSLVVMKGSLVKMMGERLHEIDEKL